MTGHDIDVQSVFSWVPKVVRKCESKHWFSCGAFHTRGEINIQEINARFHAHFQFDLHSFDEIILSFENTSF